MFEYNKDITSFTTFGIPVKCRIFAEYTSEKELLKISRSEEFINNNVLHIGGGSNLLFLEDYDGLILHSGIKGIKRYDKNQETAFLIAGAGEKWTDLVNFALENNLAGLENLAGIPGEVGASAIQNVGAYGVEAKDVIHHVECFDTLHRKTVIFNNEECRFGYRDSAFKKEWKGRYYVLRIAFKLIPGGKPFSLEYGPLKELSKKIGREPNIREVAEEIIAIRNSKLPDPAIIGSAGSFFKNPEIRKRFHQELEELSGIKIPYHPLPFTGDFGAEMVKLNAAWLIDQCGLKGYTVGGASVYSKQPLVIVNNGTATAEDVCAVATHVEKEVRKKFFLHLFPEVNFIDTRIKVTVLGSGTSKGVPEIGCLCKTCTSSDPRDKRRRASILVETSGMKILIDPSPDFRKQALDIDLADIDAVLITHSHYDHVGGMDDLRPFCTQHHVPVYARADVADDFRRRLDYCFSDKHYPGVPTFDLHEIENRPFEINGLKIEPVNVLHGQKPIFGYRIGKLGYVTDAKTIPEEELDKLYGLDTLIINSLRDREHFAHLTIEEALRIIEKLKPRRAFLTHLCHEVEPHADFIKRLPENVEPAYDGLTFIVK